MRKCSESNLKNLLHIMMYRVTATGLSGLQAQQSVPNFGNMIGQLDPAVAATINALNTTLPNSLGFVHTL